MLEIEFYSLLYYRWRRSHHSGRYISSEMASDVFAQSRAYRVRQIGTDLPWEHVPTNSYQRRFKDSNAEFWDQLDNIPRDSFPVTDVLYMTEISQPPESPQPPTEPTMPISPASSPVPPPAPDCLVDIQVGRNKDDGKLTMTVNAVNLHALLDSMGAKHDGASYHDKPSSNFSVISDGKMSPHLLLRREYPLRVALAPCFTRPPTVPQLTALCESGHAAIKNILDHYQPVDIRYSVVKVVK